MQLSGNTIFITGGGSGIGKGPCGSVSRGPVDAATTQAILTTNLLGPIRMTSALIEHFKAQPRAVIINNTSVVAYVPLAGNAVYSASKAALHLHALASLHAALHQREGSGDRAIMGRHRSG